MRRLIAVGATALWIAGCGGGSSSSAGGGSCPTMPSGAYMLHWASASANASCQQLTPPDVTATWTGDAGLAMNDPGAGSCTQALSGCAYSANCTETLGDAGSVQASYMVNIGNTGSITGTATIAYDIASMMTTCTFSLTATKQ